MKVVVRLFAACAILALTVPANADCTCQCVNGQMQPLCSSAIDLPPICPPTICPITAPFDCTCQPADASTRSAPRHVNRRGSAIKSGTVDGAGLPLI